jgi:hypothetical protein
MLIMEKTECQKFETCSAGLCPLDPHPRRYWYADTEICSRRGDVSGWIKTQKKIIKINPNPHTYYTQKMLESIDRVKPGITGIQNIGYSESKERDWINERRSKKSVA